MRLGIIHSALCSPTIEESFGRAKGVGADGVEIVYKDAASWRLVNEPKHVQMLREVSGKHGLAIPSVSLNFLCAEPALIRGDAVSERNAKEVLTAIELAAQIGAGVVLVPFFGRNIIETEDELSAVIEVMAELCDPAEDAGVILGLETTLNLHQMQYVLSSLGNTPGVRSYCDTGNMLARKVDPVTVIRTLGRSGIAQVHAKDVKLGNGAPPDFNMPLGAGDVDFGSVVEALRAIDYDDWIILETPPGSDPAAAAKANFDYLRTIVGPGKR